MRWVLAVMITLITSSVIASGYADHRQVVEVDENAHRFILAHMRNMMETLTRVQTHLLNEEPEKVHEEISRLQCESHAAKPRRLGKQLPKPFKAMGKQLDRQWDILAEPSTDIRFLQQKVVETMHTCNSCHRVFAIQRKQL